MNFKPNCCPIHFHLCVLNEYEYYKYFLFFPLFHYVNLIHAHFMHINMYFAFMTALILNIKKKVNSSHENLINWLKYEIWIWIRTSAQYPNRFYWKYVMTAINRNSDLYTCFFLLCFVCHSSLFSSDSAHPSECVNRRKGGIKMETSIYAIPFSFVCHFICALFAFASLWKYSNDDI